MGPASAWSITGAPKGVCWVSGALPLLLLRDIPSVSKASFEGGLFPWINLQRFSLQIAAAPGSYPKVATSAL